MANLNFNSIISTLTYRAKEISKQKFYEVDLPEYLPISVGQGAYSEEILYSQSYNTGTNFEDGIFQTSSQNGLLANAKPGFNFLKAPNNAWGSTVTFNQREIGQAQMSGNIDYIDATLSDQKKVADLGLQRTAFLGLDSRPAVTGLLNNPNVFTVTTLITGPIGSYTTDQVRSLMGQILGIYSQNANSTALPDTFLMPLSDYLNITTPYSQYYGPSIKDVLEMGFKQATGNLDFKILPSAYADADNNPQGLNYYMLYRREDSTSLIMDIPMPFQSFAQATPDGFHFNNTAMMEFTGVTFRRPREAVYFTY